MTSSLPPKSRSTCGFTLVELLIVIGIIVALATLLLPMAGKVSREAVRTRMAADLAVISGALEAYRADFGNYPRMGATRLPTSAKSGAALLCWALVAPGPATAQATIPGDGADGPGFRLRGTTGAIKGPYLPVDRFTIGAVAFGMSEVGVVTPNPPPPAVAVPDNSTYVLADRYYHPILYYSANKGADPANKSVPNGAFVNTAYDAQALFNYDDNPVSANLRLDIAPNILKPKVMQFRLGDTGDGTGAVPDGFLEPNETAAALGPYLVWAAGPDGYFGTDDDVVDNGAAVNLNVAALPATVYP